MSSASVIGSAPCVVLAIVGCCILVIAGQANTAATVEPAIPTNGRRGRPVKLGDDGKNKAPRAQDDRAGESI
jgi:hypothetical protein